MNCELLYGETIIDTWPISYNAPWGEKYTGKVTITNKRLVFEPDVGKGAAVAVTRLMSDYMEFLKDNIIKVEQKNTLFSKKIIVTVADNSSHIFNYGVMNTDKIVAAINSVI